MSLMDTCFGWMFLHVEAGINEVQIIFVTLHTIAMFGDGYLKMPDYVREEEETTMRKQ